VEGAGGVERATGVQWRWSAAAIREEEKGAAFLMEGKESAHRALVRGAAGEAVRHAAPLAATARAGKRPKRQPMARVGRLLSDACRAERLRALSALPSHGI